MFHVEHFVLAILCVQLYTYMGRMMKMYKILAARDGS